MAGKVLVPRLAKTGLHMDVSTKLGVLFVGVVRIKALLFGVYITDPVFVRLPYALGNLIKVFEGL